MLIEYYYMDKIFIVNLKHREDRKKKILTELQLNNIINYEFFNAIRPNIEEVNNWNNSYCSHFDNSNKNLENYKIGSLGCLLSHYNIIKLSLERDYNKIMILEDDAYFKSDYNDIEKYSETLGNYDMLYLSGSHLGKKQIINNNIIKIEGTYTTTGYIINRGAMEYLVDNITGYSKEIDVFYAEEIQPRFNCYCTIPHIIHQREGYSDIQNKNVKYKVLE